MAEVPLGSLISVMQNCFFTKSSIKLPASTKKANLPAALLLKPPPLSAIQSSGSASESDQSALSTSEEKRREFFNLFRDYGFQDPQIQKLIDCGLARKTRLNLQTKLDFFVENGFKGTVLPELITSCPYILNGSLDSCIKPKFQVLKQYLDSDEKVVTVINRSRWITFGADFKLNFIPNIEFLINEGVPVDRVSHLLLSQPNVLMQSRDRMTFAFKTVREYGAAPDDPMFIHFLRAVSSLSESNLKKKLEVFKSFGWSDEQTLNILKKHPSCLNLSEERLRSRNAFLINTIMLEPDTVIRCPLLLACSEERILARYEVLKVLKSKKLIRDVKITTVVPLSEDRFLKSYVIKHVERVPGILDMYYAIANERRRDRAKKLKIQSQ